MSEARLFSGAVYLALKSAVRRSTKLAGGQESVASVTRVRSHVSIGRYGRPQDAEHCPIDVAVDIDAEAGAPLITRAMADALGYVLIAKPPANADAEWVRHLGAIAQQAGEAMAKLGEAVSDDGAIDAEEIRTLGLRAAIREAMEALAGADAALREIEDTASGLPAGGGR